MQHGSDVVIVAGKGQTHCRCELVAVIVRQVVHVDGDAAGCLGSETGQGLAGELRASVALGALQPHTDSSGTAGEKIAFCVTPGWMCFTERRRNQPAGFSR